VQAALAEALAAGTAAVKCRILVSACATAQAEEFFVAHAHLGLDFFEVFGAVSADHQISQGTICATRVPFEFAGVGANEAPRTVCQIGWQAHSAGLRTCITRLTIRSRRLSVSINGIIGIISCSG